MAVDAVPSDPHRPALQLGRTLGTGRDWRRRLLAHHLPIAAASVLVLLTFTGLSLFTDSFSHDGAGGGPFGLSFDPSSRGFTSQLTVATGYLATALLALTMLVGPANLLLRRRNPLSNYLRRDLGTWTVIFSATHVILAFRSAYRGAFSFIDFFFVGGRPLTDDFGLGNWTGLAALVLASGLLAISTTRAVRELGTARWKGLQRLNYTVFALVILHAVFYGALLRMGSPFTVLLICIVLSVLTAQATGIWLWRRRQAATTTRRTLAPESGAEMPPRTNYGYETS